MLAQRDGNPGTEGHAISSSWTQRRISACGSGDGVVRGFARPLYRAETFGTLLNPEIASVEHPGPHPPTLGRIPRGQAETDGDGTVAARFAAGPKVEVSCTGNHAPCLQMRGAMGHYRTR